MRPDETILTKQNKYYDNLTADTSRALRSKSTLAFPESRSEAYDGRIRFTVHKAEPLDVNFGSFFQLPIFDNVFRRNKDESQQVYDDAALRQVRKDESKQKEDAKKEGYEAASSILKGASYRLDLGKPIVDMYLPISIQINDAAVYENANLGALGAGVFGGLQNDASVLQSAYKGIQEGLSNIFGYVMNNDQMGAEASRLAAIRASKALPSGIQNAVSLGVQRTVNPNTRALFRGVNLREFTFTFKMIASSAKEASVVQDIIKHFRTEMYPDIYDPANSGLPLAYKFPNAFGIQFLYKGKEAQISRIERCFLRGVTTNYNPQAATFHADGQPVEIDMTLNFVEMRTLNKKDIEKGY